MKKILFGAGQNGRIAIEKFGRDKFDYVCDNSPSSWGKKLQTIEIISPSQLTSMGGDDVEVYIDVCDGFMEIIDQLEEMGVKNYHVYPGNAWHNFLSPRKLVFAGYGEGNAVKDEAEWNHRNNDDDVLIKKINETVENWYRFRPLFTNVEIETYNRCNGICSFCPVNRHDDSRIEEKMTEEVFFKIIADLASIDYCGKVALFSNNEPLLDDRIYNWHRYVRNELPYAHMHLFTNGTLLTLDKYLELCEVLDEIVIDNYQKESELIKPVQEIFDYCQDHPEYIKKTSILIRKPTEILTSRGGTAPNRSDIPDTGSKKCTLPFWQFIIRPSGKVSLCCNDALGKYTLGDVKEDSMVDIWYGDKFSQVRDALRKGRKYWGSCSRCDTFS